MTIKTQKIISASLVFLSSSFSFWALISIVNVNQIAIFLGTAFIIWLYLWVKIAFLFDLHFKTSRLEHMTVWGRFFDALYDRFKHLIQWKYYSQALHYLLLPGLLFWSTVTVFYIELGHLKIQSFIAGLSIVALTVNYYYIKEVFDRKKERVDEDVFIALSVVKVYTSAVVFGAALALMRRFCLDPYLFAFTVFPLTFLLLWQALYQHKLAYIKNMLIALILSAGMGVVGFFVYQFWGYNFFTAAMLFAAIYNLLWGSFHYYLDKALTKRALLEILLLCFFIGYLVFSVTNFKARLLDGCF